MSLIAFFWSAQEIMTKINVVFAFDVEIINVVTYPNDSGKKDHLIFQQSKILISR